MANIGGHFAGDMTPEGSGARVRAGVRDVPIIGDIDLVNVHVPGFRGGGRVDGDHRTPPPPPPRPRHSGSNPSSAATGDVPWGQARNPLASLVGGGQVGYHGMGGGTYYCPSCAAGITKPV